MPTNFISRSSNTTVKIGYDPNVAAFGFTNGILVEPEFSGFQGRPAADPVRKIRAIVDGKGVEFDSIQAKFDALADSWDEENLGSAKIDFRRLSFLQIIGIGPGAVPFLIKRVESGETRWIYALKCITGEEPETKEMNGEPAKIIEAWSSWWKRRNHGGTR